MPSLKVKKLDENAILPKYQTSGAACFDLHWCTYDCTLPFDICPGSPVVLGTGLAFEVPVGYVMLLYSRSGHGFKNNVRMANCVGVIDSDYRGELRVKLSADGGQGGRSDFLGIKPGDRIAQAMLMPVEQWDLIEVDELSDTARGTGGYGSTGA